MPTGLGFEYFYGFVGDNDTSAEGDPMGTPNEVAFFNGVNKMPVEEQMKWYDVWGTEEAWSDENHAI